MSTPSLQTSIVVGLVAGEASGDILGASLMRALRAHHPQIHFVGVGGPLMQAEGLKPLFSYERLAVMGIVDVIKQLPDLLRARREVIGFMLEEQPDVFVGIDAPDFNIPIEARLKKAGITTVHYVSPSVWAWRQKRVFKIAQATDNVLCLLPFEKQFYDRYNVPATFVGHTLADEIAVTQAREPAYEALGLDPKRRYLGLLPGSRRGEVALLLPPFLNAAVLLHQQDPELQFIIPAAGSERLRQIHALVDAAQLPASLVIHIVEGQSRAVMTAADAVLLASGTVALEAMLLKTPMLVAYRFSPLNFAILKRMVKVDHFSLPNLLAGKALVTELLQDEVTPERLAQEAEHLLHQPQQPLIDQFTTLHRSLQLDAADSAAKAVLATLAKADKS